MNAGDAYSACFLLAASAFLPGCADDDKGAIPKPRHGLPGTLIVRDLSDTQRAALCEDTVSRLQIAEDHAVRCTNYAIRRSQVADCEALRAECLAGKDEEPDAVSAASICAGEVGVPGRTCDLAVAEYSRCAGILAGNLRARGDACYHSEPPDGWMTECPDREGCGFVWY